MNPESSELLLFSLQSTTVDTKRFSSKPKQTLFIVTAREVNSTPGEQSRKSASRLKGMNPTRIEIGGHEFWKGELIDKVSRADAYTLIYATAVNGYVLQFSTVSRDNKIAQQLEQSVEHIEFFDPSKAPAIAGPDSRPYHPASTGS